MLLSAILGVLSGVMSIGAWWLFRVCVESTGVYQWIEQRWYLVPLALGLAVFLYMRKAARRSSDFYPDALPDLIEEYHFGIQRSSTMTWVFRSLVSFCGAFFGGIFGFEGGVLEGVTAVLQYAISKFPQRFHRLIRHDAEVRQTMVAGSLAGAFSVVFGAPFAGALLALEVLMVSGVRARAAAFTSSLTAYGLSRALASALNLESLGMLQSLFQGLKPLSLEYGRLAVLSGFTILVGALVGVLTLGFGHWLLFLRTKMNGLKQSAARLALMAGFIIAGMALLTPEAFLDPARLWQLMAWGHVSAPSALIHFTARAIMLSFALAALGSSGFVTALMFLGALLGYAIGGAVISTWALPLALACCAAVLAGGFSAPLAATALVLEIGHDGGLWWLSLMAVAGAYGAVSFLKGAPLLTLMLQRRNIKLVNGRCANVLSQLEMRDAMVRDFDVLPESATIVELQRVAASSSYSVLGVTSPTGEFRGLLSLDQLPNNVELKGISPTDLLDRQAIEVKTSDPLEQALDHLTSVPVLAVVDDQRVLVGLIFKSGVLARYQREVGRRALSYYTARRFTDRSLPQ